MGGGVEEDQVGAGADGQPADVVAVEGERETAIATMLATVMALHERPGIDG